MNPEVNHSVRNMWFEFIHSMPEYSIMSIPEIFYFCDNKKDADACADLVVRGVKKATSPSLWWFKTNGIDLPKVGDLFIITDWDGLAKAIIKTSRIDTIAFQNITERYAQTEGEGDKSLSYWKKTHWDYYTREMKAYNTQPTPEMMIVCQQFRTIWK